VGVLVIVVARLLARNRVRQTSREVRHTHNDANSDGRTAGHMTMVVDANGGVKRPTSNIRP
jgi:hypothetical protein